MTTSCTNRRGKSQEGLPETWNLEPGTGFMVPSAGLEPAWVAPYAPQTYVSTNSTTTAWEAYFFGAVEGVAAAVVEADVGGGTGKVAGTFAAGFALRPFGASLMTEELGRVSTTASASARTMKAMKNPV